MVTLRILALLLASAAVLASAWAFVERRKRIQDAASEAWRQAERQRLAAYTQPSDHAACYLLFAEQSTGIVLNADAQTRYRADVHPNYFVPFGSLETAEARAREVLASGAPVEISLFDAERQYLRQLRA